MITDQNTNRQTPPPALGHLSTKCLVKMLMGIHLNRRVVLRVPPPDCTVDDLRDELRRREALGVGVAR